jgi:hypothetical protein
MGGRVIPRNTGSTETTSGGTSVMAEFARRALGHGPPSAGHAFEDRDDLRGTENDRDADHDAERGASGDLASPEEVPDHCNGDDGEAGPS